MNDQDNVFYMPIVPQVEMPSPSSTELISYYDAMLPSTEKIWN